MSGNRTQFKKSFKPYFGINKPKSQEEEEESEEQRLNEHLISVNGNTIMFHSDITSKSSFMLINAFNIAINNIQKLNPNDPTSIPINLHINTDGGEIYKVLGIIAHMAKLPYKINTICEGCVASAGVLLSMAGNERSIDENAYMLVHEIRSGMWGKYSECIDDMYNNKKIMKDIKKYFKKQSNNKFPEEIMEKILKRDILLDPKKCLKYGLVDKINTF